MNFKRVLALFLTLSTLLSFFSCGSAEEGTGSEETEAQATTEEVNTLPTEEETAEEELPSNPAPLGSTGNSTTTTAAKGTAATTTGQGTVSTTTKKNTTTTTAKPTTTTTTATEAPFVPSVGYGQGQSYSAVLKNNLTMAQLNAIPVARQGMTAQQLRDICWDFMAMQMNVGWKTDQSFTTAIGSNSLVYKTGTLYGGMPYSSSTFNNIYQFLYYYDPATSKLDVNALQSNAVAIALKESNQKDLVAVQLGNQCSASSLWAWSRVSNVVSWGGTSGIFPANGAILLGDALAAYHKQHYSNVKDYHKEGIATKDILAAVGRDKVYEGYKLLQKADGLAYYNKGGHVMMVHHVDVARQRVYLQDQTGRGNATGTHPAAYHYYTFSNLYNDGYVPFTIPEFIGQDPVEKGFVTFSHSGSTANVTQLLSAEIDSNYMISDVTVKVMNGNQAVEEYFYTTTINLSLFGAQAEEKGAVSLKSTNAKKNLGATESQYNAFVGRNYKVLVDVRLSTGEVFTVYNGTLS